MRVSFSSQLRLPPPRYSPSTNSSPAASRSESARTAAEISSSDTQLTQQNLARRIMERKFGAAGTAARGRFLYHGNRCGRRLSGLGQALGEGVPPGAPQGDARL